MRYILLAAVALSMPMLTDWLVDRQFAHEQSYTRADIQTLDRLVTENVCDDWLCQLDEARRAR